MTLCVTVGGDLVVGTPLGRSNAAFAFLTLLPPVGTILLRKLRAVALEVAGSLTVLLDAATIAAPCPELGGADGFLDRSSIWKLIAVRLICSRLKE